MHSAFCLLVLHMLGFAVSKSGYSLEALRCQLALQVLRIGDKIGESKCHFHSPLLRVQRAEDV